MQVGMVIHQYELTNILKVKILICIVITSINVTSIGGEGAAHNKDRLAAIESHIILIQEHAVPQGKVAQTKADLDKEGWNAHIGCCDPERSRTTGGVGKAISA